MGVGKITAGDGEDARRRLVIASPLFRGRHAIAAAGARSKGASPLCLTINASRRVRVKNDQWNPSSLANATMSSTNSEVSCGARLTSVVTSQMECRATEWPTISASASSIG